MDLILSLRGPASDPVSEINSWKLALQKPDAEPQGRCAKLTRLQRPEHITLSLFLKSQERVFHPGISRALTHFKTHIALVQSSHSRAVDTSQRLQFRKSDILQEGAAWTPFQGCCQRKNFPLFAPTWMFIWNDRSVWMNDSCCPSTNDTLPQSQQGSDRDGQSELQSNAPSVLPVSVNTN